MGENEGMPARRVQSDPSPAGATYVALLRGINVGKARPVAMDDLRRALEALGYTSVSTLLRSGNAVFAAPETDPALLGAAISAALSEGFDMDIGVVVRSAVELEAIIVANPLPEAAADSTNLHVLFLAEPLTAQTRESIEADDYTPDDVRCAERELYVWYRRGMSGSKTSERLGRKLRSHTGTATDRNWNTVGKLAAMTRQP
jgi:uncharacterized protein (DUF1697 family)